MWDQINALEWKRQDTLFLVGTLAWVIFLLALLPVESYLYREDMPYFHALEYAVRAAINQGQVPLWNPYFAEPLLANPQAMVFYPTHFLLRFLPVSTMLTIDIGFHLWLMVAALYILLRDWGLSRPASMGGALSVGFSTMIIVRVIAGHMASIPTYPWSIAALIVYRRLLHRPNFSNLILSVLTTVLIILSGHSQQSFTALLIPASYFLYFILTHREWKQVLRASLLSVVVGVICIGLLAFQLLPMLEYFPETIRVDGYSFEDAAVYYLPPVLLVNMLTPFLPYQLLPQLYGFQERTLYISLMTIGLAGAAVRFGPERYRGLTRFLALIGIVVILLAMGDRGPIFYFFFLLFPFLRTPGRFLQVWVFCAALLTGIGIEAIIEADDEDEGRRISNWLWFTLVFTIECAIVLLVIDAYVFHNNPAESGTLSLFVLNIAVALIWAVVLLAKRVRLTASKWPWLWVGALFVDVTLTAVYLFLWPAYRTAYPSRAETYLEAGNPYACAASQIVPWDIRLEDPDGADLPMRLAASAGIQVLHSYSANLTYMNDLAAMTPARDDLLASRYLFLSEPPPQDQRWKPLLTACGVTLWEGEDVLPRIYAVSDVITVPDTRPDSLAAVAMGAFDPQRTAIISRTPSGSDLPLFPFSMPEYEARITRYTPGEIRVSVETSGRILVILADPYYPGWQVWVDGDSARIWRVNHALRGVVVNEGQHELVFEYRPRSFRLGVMISLVTLGLVLAGGAAAILKDRRNYSATPHLHTL